MSLAENIISQVSNTGLSGVIKPDGFNLNDTTFAELLEKQMDEVQPMSRLNGEFGIPVGLIIEPYDKEDDSNNKIGDIKAMEETQITDFEMKEIKTGDYFSEFLKDTANRKSPVMNFAIKQATNSYSAFGRSLVTDITDFAKDIIAAS